MLGTDGEVRKNINDVINELLHIDTPLIADQQKVTFICSGQTLDAVQRTYQK